MITRENKSKLHQKTGDKALAKLVGDAPPVAHPEAADATAPWVHSDAVRIGVQGRDGFMAMSNMLILNISREYRRRFAALGEAAFCEAVFAVRTVMLCRARMDFPDCRLGAEIVQPAGDLCVVVNEGPGGEYLADPRVLQGRLDDACARFAACLGV